MAALAAALAGAFLYPGLGASGLGGAFWDGLGTPGEVLYVLGGLLLYNLLSAAEPWRGCRGFSDGWNRRGRLWRSWWSSGLPPFFESVTGFGVAGGDQRAYPARGGLLATSGRGAIELGAVRGAVGRVGIGTGDRGGPLRHELRGALDLSALLSLPLSPSTPSPP